MCITTPLNGIISFRLILQNRKVKKIWALVPFVITSSNWKEIVDAKELEKKVILAGGEKTETKNSIAKILKKSVI